MDTHQFPEAARNFLFSSQNVLHTVGSQYMLPLSMKNNCKFKRLNLNIILKASRISSCTEKLERNDEIKFKP